MKRRFSVCWRPGGFDSGPLLDTKGFDDLKMAQWSGKIENGIGLLTRTENGQNRN